MSPAKPSAKASQAKKPASKGDSKTAPKVSEADAAGAVVAVRRRASRADGVRTQDLILQTAAALLEEVGFEKLSTGLICERAGLTPPALYRYFPNKYSVLFDLAHSLLIHQQTILDQWVQGGGFEWSDDATGMRKLDALQRALREFASSRPGAIWILRGLRSVPLLLPLRVVARREMLKVMLKGISEHYPHMTRRALQIPVRLLGEIIHMETELELDEPDLNEAELRRSVSMAVVAYIAAFTKKS